MIVKVQMQNSRCRGEDTEVQRYSGADSREVLLRCRCAKVQIWRCEVLSRC